MNRLVRSCSLSAALLAGCASATSTLVESESGRSCATDVRGKGYPMTVKVATHLKVTIYENVYFETLPEIVAAQAAVDAAKARNASATAQTGSATTPANAGDQNQNLAGDSATASPNSSEGSAEIQSLSSPDPETPVAVTVSSAETKLNMVLTSLGNQPTTREVIDNDNLPIRTYDFATQVLETESIVLVDQKRPAAGTLAYRTAISPDYSFDRIQSKSEDVTIRQVGYGIASTIAALTGAPPPKNPAALRPSGKLDEFKDLTSTKHSRPEAVSAKLPAAPANLFTLHREIASRVFDLNDPDLELQIAEFLSVALPRPSSCPAKHP